MTLLRFNPIHSKRPSPHANIPRTASWRSGYAEDCKAATDPTESMLILILEPLRAKFAPDSRPCFCSAFRAVQNGVLSHILSLGSFVNGEQHQGGVSLNITAGR